MRDEFPVLSGYRLLELADEPGVLCGKVFADLGADVLKIEAPRGGPDRERAPFAGDRRGENTSLHFAAYNAGKRGLTLDLEREEGREIFLDLVARADFVIDSYAPGVLQTLGLEYASLARANPRIIHASVTPFGQEGPYREFASTEMVTSALAGLLYMVGEPGEAPVHTNFPMSVHAAAALDAATGLLVAHHERERSGLGQYIDVSAQEAAKWMTFDVALRWELEGAILRRAGAALEYAEGIRRRVHWRCSDGWVAFAVFPAPSSYKSARSLTEWMQEEGYETGAFGEASWEDLDYFDMSEKDILALEDPVAKFFEDRSMQELYDGALDRAILLAPAMTAREIVESPQLEALDFWAEVADPDRGGDARYPRFLRSSEVSVGVRRRAPRLGEHNQEVYENELGIPAERLRKLGDHGVV
ncbi:MAG: CoA transferase [Myxococcales bacterium]|nr:CoA transferase [Myxococcales bacterium]